MLLSVDGGATKTVAIIFDDEKSEIKGIGISGPSNLGSAGPKTAGENILSATQSAMERAKVDLNTIDDGIFGIAGIGDSKEMTELGNSIIRKISGSRDFIIVNDGIPAYYLGNLENDGIVFAGGTGSVAFYRKNENMGRRGGWNWFVGDDGSASWIAKRAINVATMEEDGIFPEKLLVNEVESYFGADFREAIALVDKFQDKSLVAGFAPNVSRLANNGYKRALNIMSESAGYVVAMINSLKSEFSKVPDIAVLGGTVQAGVLYKNMITSEVKEKIEFFLGYQVSVGGILILLQKRGKKINKVYRDEMLRELDSKLRNMDAEILEKYLHFRS
jgi:N-acetylglucosamine kinase